MPSADPGRRSGQPLDRGPDRLVDWELARIARRYRTIEIQAGRLPAASAEGICRTTLGQRARMTSQDDPASPLARQVAMPICYPALVRSRQQALPCGNVDGPG
jgi:hypothetical protein